MIYGRKESFLVEKLKKKTNWSIAALQSKHILLRDKTAPSKPAACLRGIIIIHIWHNIWLKYQLFYILLDLEKKDALIVNISEDKLLFMQVTFTLYNF